MNFLFQAVLLGLQALAEISTNPAGQGAINNISFNNDSTVKEVTICTNVSTENSLNSETMNSSQIDSSIGGDSDTVGANTHQCDSVGGNAQKYSASECKSVPNDYFTKFMKCLIDLFKKDRSLLQKRGPFIIRYVCNCSKILNISCQQKKKA